MMTEDKPVSVLFNFQGEIGKLVKELKGVQQENARLKNTQKELIAGIDKINNVAVHIRREKDKRIADLEAAGTKILTCESWNLSE